MRERCARLSLVLLMLCSGCATQQSLVAECPQIPQAPEAVRNVQHEPSFSQQAKPLLDLLNVLIQRASQ
jgi:hypothetical protein